MVLLVINFVVKPRILFGRLMAKITIVFLMYIVHVSSLVVFLVLHMLVVGFCVSGFVVMWRLQVFAYMLMVVSLSLIHI